MNYEDIAIGTKKSLVHSVSRQDIEKFVELTGDDNKLHVDEDYASNTSFKRPVVHGMLSASFISTIIGTKLPGDGALWFSQTLEFLLPVRIGDEITINAEVIKKYDRDRIIELNIEISNQNRQIVTRGISKVKVIQQKNETKTNSAIKDRVKTALILGATGGIGYASCMHLAKDGFNLLIHYMTNKTKAMLLQKEVEKYGVKAYIFQADTSDENKIDELIEYSTRKFSSIDVFVNCAAAIIPPIKALDLRWNDILDQLNQNIKVNLQIIQALLPEMIANKYGKIVTIGTLYVDKPNNNLIHYIAAKAALEGFTKALALEVAPSGINVNMVSPSIIDTNLTADIPEKVKLITATQTPLRRLATAEDIAGIISFLAGDNSNYLSGINIRANGGQIMV